MNISRFSPHFTFANVSSYRLIGLLLLAIALFLRLFFMWTSLIHLPATSDEASLALLAKMIWKGDLPLLFTGQPYQFPIEAYVMAPLIEWLPRNAFGVRYQTFLLGLASVFGFLAIIRAVFPSGARWPAVLLVLFPSAYLLMVTAAYAPPQYSMSLTLAWLSIYAVVGARSGSHRWLLLAGLCCGLGVSNHLLTLTVSAGVVALVICCGSLGRALRGTVFFSAGFVIGAIPYLLALWLVPGAYENLPGTIKVSHALVRMVDPGITETLAGAMGVKPVLFPDFREHLGGMAGIRKIFALLYIILFCSLVAERGIKFLTDLRNRSWPKLGVVDLALITSMLAIGLFAFHRTAATSYRYLLPAVWCFPFLLGHAYVISKSRLRIMVGCAAAVLAIFNFTVSAKVIAEWRNPGQIEQFSDTHRIDTLLEKLREKDISHCYASFWLAYRITFESDEQIICSLPYNERFPGWPIPYKKQVDQQADAAYILTQTFGARLTALSFQQQLKSYGVTAEKYLISPFTIYYGFRFPPSAGGKERVLPATSYTMRTDSGGEELLPRLQDEDIKTAWISSRKQEKGDWIRIDFDSAMTISGITLFPVQGRKWSPGRFVIDGYKVVDGNGTWHRIKGPLQPIYEHIRFVNNHPVYHQGESQQILFKPVRINALRVKIVQPQEQVPWGLAEVEITTTDDES
ncbi:MAG: discoidin domain-containing protein [Desulforhopalus sp.]